MDKVHSKESQHIALTFDDGPNPRTTPIILEELRKRKIKATFFLVGEKVEKHPELAKRIVEEGHDIGNHSYTHINLANLDKQGVKKEIEFTQGIIKKTTGKRPVLFRPPYGTYQ